MVSLQLHYNRNGKLNTDGMIAATFSLSCLPTFFLNYLPIYVLIFTFFDTCLLVFLYFTHFLIFIYFLMSPLHPFLLTYFTSLIIIISFFVAFLLSCSGFRTVLIRGDFLDHLLTYFISFFIT